ncbi:MAG: potassium channel family protein [Candidatus Pacearchaeota archaeon]|jgi:hypothetical protein
MEIRGNVIIILGIFIFGILIGALIYQNVEGWSFIDSLYFVVVTVTTIGYGDLSPSTDVGKIFTMFFAFFGVATALYLFSNISSALFKKHVTQKVSEIKRDVKQEQTAKEEFEDTVKKVIEKHVKRTHKKR